jgi:hypothetical protein
MFVVPGQDVLGHGVMLEMYGFTVAVFEPESDLTKAAGKEVLVPGRRSGRQPGVSHRSRIG